MGKFVSTFEGVVGTDPAVKFTPSGKAVVDVSVAVSGRVKVGEEYQDTPTAWVKATFWEHEAEWIGDNVAKGAIFSVSGDVLVEEYQRKDGTPGWNLLIKNPETWGVKPKRPKAGSVASNMAEDPWKS